MEELLNKHQKIRFSGTGASHQNETAERAIKTVLALARNMFMHAALRCHEDILSTDFCPTSMYYDVWVYNRTPDMQS